MRKQKYTGQEQRKLSYEPKQASKEMMIGLELPQSFKSKISQPEYIKIKQAFYIEANQHQRLNRSSFPIVMRSLGVVNKTTKFYDIFDEIDEKTMAWRQFLQAYIALRNQKGSYNEISQAVYTLDKEYKGNWDQFFLDLQQIGDNLSPEEMDILKHDILKGKTVTNEALINGLLGYK